MSKIAAAKKMELHSVTRGKMQNIERDLQRGKMSREDAINSAAEILKIDPRKKWDAHFKALEDSIPKH